MIYIDYPSIKFNNTCSNFVIVIVNKLCGILILLYWKFEYHVCLHFQNLFPIHVAVDAEKQMNPIHVAAMMTALHPHL